MGKTCIPMQRVQIQPLVRELRPHIPQGQKQKQKQFVKNSKTTLKMVHIKKKKKILRRKFTQPKHWIYSILNKMKMAFFTKTEHRVLSVAKMDLK